MDHRSLYDFVSRYFEAEQILDRIGINDQFFCRHCGFYIHYFGCSGPSGTGDFESVDVPAASQCFDRDLLLTCSKTHGV